MTGKRVVRLLAREKDIRDKFAKGGSDRPAGFEDVVQQIGEEYAPRPRRVPRRRCERGVRPDHPALQPHRRGRLLSRHVRYSHRTVGEGNHRAVPHRRHLPREIAVAQEGRPRAGGPLQDHVQPRHRGTPVAAGRAHRLQAVHQKKRRYRSARLHGAAQPRRRRGDAHPRQAEIHAAAACARLHRGESRQNIAT